MKKLLKVLSSLIFIISLSSCLTTIGLVDVYGERHIRNVDGTEFSYDIYTNYFEDIENPFYTIETQFPMVDEYKYSKDDVLSFTIFYSEKGSNLSVEIIYQGSDWRFMEGEMKYKIDNKIYTFIDDDPYRDVISGEGVKEKISNYPVNLNNNKDYINGLMSSNKITVQYYSSPYTLTSENIKIVNDFISKYMSMSYKDVEQLHNSNL